MGFGDVKLMGMLGAWLGFLPAILLILFLSRFLGTIFTIAYAAVKRTSMRNVEISSCVGVNGGGVLVSGASTLDVDTVERERSYHIYNLENVQAEDLADTLTAIADETPMPPAEPPVMTTVESRNDMLASDASSGSSHATVHAATR